MMMPVSVHTGLSRRSFRGARISRWSKPGRRALQGGDWCDAFPVSTDRLAISIGDVCGRGAAAYEPMLGVREAIRARAYRTRDLLEIMASANEMVCRRGNDFLVTALVGMLDIPTRTLEFTSAGHPRPLVQNAGTSLFIGKLPGSLPLGIDSEYSGAVYSVTVLPGSLFVFYTDGIVERNHAIIDGERELIWAAAHVYRYPYLNAASTIASVLTEGSYDLEDDASIITVRTA